MEVPYYVENKIEIPNVIENIRINQEFIEVEVDNLNQYQNYE